MRRPFAVIGFTFLAALVAASYIGFGISAAMAVFCLVCAAVVLFGLAFLKWRITLVVALCAAAAAFVSFCLAECFWYAPALALSGKTAQISGVIADTPQVSYGKYIYTINADKITVDGSVSKVKTKIRLQMAYELQAEPFDRITAQVTLSAPNTQNASGFDSRSYYKSKGVYLFATATQVDVTPESKKPPYYYAIQLRLYISSSINKFVGGNVGALADGILIGDTSGLPDGVSSDFSATGISHILAVSGTQTSLIMEYLMLLLCALRLKRRPSAAITAAAIVLFMAVTGFSPSVMRAGIMSIVCLLGLIIKRDADVLNSLGISALILCLVNPYAATDVGLLLSLTATLGMVIISKRLNAKMLLKTQKLPDKIKGFVRMPLSLLAETIGASLLTYPVIILVFGRISIISLLANIVEVPISLFVTLATAVLAIFSPAPFLVFLIKPIAILIRLCCAFMMWFAHALASLPFATVSAAYGFVDIFLVFAATLFVLYFVFRGRGATAGACLACVCFVLSVGIFTYLFAARGVMTVEMTSTDGGAIIVCNGHAVVIDLPTTQEFPQEAVENYLKPRNINTIDAVIMTSYNKKRAQSLASLESVMPVARAYMPAGGDSTTDTGFALPEKVSVPSVILAPYGVSITMLPDSAGDNLIALVSCDGSKVIVTGGSNSGDYSAYNPLALKADMLVFGGNLDSSFEKEVSPSYAAGGKGAADSIALLESEGASVKNSPGIFMTRGSGYFTSY
jgi:competence protein ComEC